MNIMFVFNLLISFHQQKLLELSEYEVLSKSDASMSTLSNTMSLNSSVTGGISNKAVRLSFQPYAKKHFKQAIGSKHLKKHEIDGENKLTCHRLAKIGPLTTEQLSHEIRRTSLYSIIYIALNLIEDNIQLSDMRRYMLEGRISTLNVDKFFPENIRENCRKILRETFFSHGSQPNRIQDSRIRQHSVFIMKNIGIKDLKLPNMNSLCERYIKELALPKDLYKFVDRLINFYKPEMRWTAIIPPLYEARAMAYIIFVIKLLFGLDDSMESEISEASRKINESVPEANLFIFDDWMRYLEMRKIILAQASVPFSIMYKLGNESQYKTNFIDNSYVKSETDLRKNQLDNMERIIENFISKFKEEKVDEFDFSHHTLTPNTEYFDQILSSAEKIHVPGFMHTNYSDSSIEPFVNLENLKNTLKQINIKLKVENVALRPTKNITRFRCYDSALGKRYFKQVRVKKADFNIDREEYMEGIECRQAMQNRIFGNKFLDNVISVQYNFTRRTEQKIRARRKEKSFNDKQKVDIKKELFSYDDQKMGVDQDDDSNFDELVFKKSSMEFWSVMGSLKELNASQFQEVKKKLPLRFNWLVNYCANMLDTTWDTLYTEVLTLEAMFMLILEPVENLEDSLVFKEKIANMLNTYLYSW